MTTLSSRRVIKSLPENSVERFIPPVQTYERPAEPAAPVSDMKPSSPVRQHTERNIYEDAQKILDEAREEADQILAEAKQSAEALLEQTEADSEVIKKNASEEGYHLGYTEGWKNGLEQAEAEQNAALASQLQGFAGDMEQALASVKKAKEKCLRNYMEELKDCSVAVAEKVIHISLKSSGEIIKRMIIAETEKLKKTAWVKIYMEKSDYDLMVETDADIVSELTKLSDNIKFIVMEKEDRGNCIIEMPEEIVDISVNTQIENIKEILENIRT